MCISWSQSGVSSRLCAESTESTLEEVEAVILGRNRLLQTVANNGHSKGRVVETIQLI
jgi:hypothetical protein